MRATIKGMEVEGTPSEIAEFLKSLDVESEFKVGDKPTLDDSSEIIESSDLIPEKFAYRTLKRIPLSKSQKGLLLLLKEAAPDWTLASEILAKFNWEGTQLGGVLGGLGRRLTATKGYERGYKLWDWKWDDDEGEYAYRLPPPVISAIERLD